jgi:hypothetical protein
LFGPVLRWSRQEDLYHLLAAPASGVGYPHGDADVLPGVRRRRTVESLIAPCVYPRPWPNGGRVLPVDPSADERRALANANAAGALWRQFEGLKERSRAEAGIGPLRPDQMAAGIWWTSTAARWVDWWAGHMLGGRGRELLRLIREALSCRWGRSRRPTLSISGRRCSTKALLRAGMVGATGVEPVASSVSANNREPLCGRSFSQVARDRRGRS